MKKITALYFLSIICTAKMTHAQQQWESWNGLNVQIPVSKKLDLQGGHTRAYNLSNKFSSEFNQTAFQLRYNYNSKWHFSGGLQFIKPAAASESRKRYFVRAAYTTRILDRKINWTNSIRIEQNSKNERRFRQRVIVSTRIALRNRINFLNLTPSVVYTMFYNIGGNPIPYYYANSTLIDRQTPDGFHRGRFTANLNSKINDYLRLNLYFMKQTEFNFLAVETRRINVYDPVRKRTIRPFDNFNVLGVTLTLSLNDLF